MKLQLPEVWVFYDSRALSEDGRAGGYIRVSIDVDPLDVPTTWDSSGLPVYLPVAGSYSKAYVNGFNRNGTVLGNVSAPPVFPGPAGFWNDAPFSALADFGTGGAAFDAAEEVICGETYALETGGFYSGRATIWTKTGPTRVSGIGNLNSQCNAVNAAGIYVGSTRVPTGPATTRRGGFIGRDGTGEVLSYPGMEIFNAVDINDNNQFIGNWNTGSALRGFVATAFDTEIRDLGLFPGVASILPKAINNDGVIVGSALAGTDVRALIWQPGATEPTDFNTLVDLPGTTLVEAMDINNAGQILARGNTGYYIFTPIPEPAAALFVLVGGLATTRRRAAR